MNDVLPWSLLPRQLFLERMRFVIYKKEIKGQVIEVKMEWL